MNALMILVTVTVFTLMLSIGINQSFSQLLTVLRDPAQLLRSLLAVIIIVPAVAALLMLLFGLPPEVAAGITLLAAAPGAPMTTKRSETATADVDYITSLQLVLALLAILVTPLILAIFYAMFTLPIERATPLDVAQQISRVTLLPVVIGLLLASLAPKVAAALMKPVRILSTVLFLLMVLALIGLIAAVPEMRNKLAIGWTPFAVIVIFAAGALAIGHLVGGPRTDQRAGLAIACVARNVGLALFIAGLSDYEDEIFRTILAFMLVGSALAIPYSIWVKRQIKGDEKGK